MVKVFIDDIREVKDVWGYNNNPIYKDTDWVIVRSFDSFVSYVKENGVPNVVSFDHDLGEIISESKELGGFECAKWLVEFCIDNDINVPNYHVHSANPVGKKNIETYMNTAIKYLNK